MNTTQLECFLSVAENLSFARAAQQLHITQPAVTHQINSLETELNTRLFLRTTRSVELTASGFGFISDARDILGLTRTAIARVSSLSAQHISELFIGCLGYPEHGLLPPVLRILVREFPQLHPIIKQGPFPIMHNQLKEESLHVMFGFEEDRRQKLTLSPDQPDSHTKKTEAFTLLVKAPVSCVVSPDHPLACRENLTSCDLKTGSILACEPRRTSPAISAAMAPLISQRFPDQIYFCDSLSSLLTLAKAGLGLSLVPDILQLREPGLCYIPVEDIAPMRFGLFYKNKRTHPALKRFIELMAEQFASI